MTTANSGLAAVLAAATATQTETAAATLAAPAAGAHTYTAADLAAAFPDLCAQIRTEAATGERDRILGIDAIGIVGHDELVATMKADPSVSVADAGLRILRAEQALRGQQLQAVKDVEAVAVAVKPAPTTGQAAPVDATAPKSAEALKAEFEASVDLKTEFGSADNYVAFKVAEAGGKIRILGKK